MSFVFHSPSTIAEAVALKQQCGKNGYFLAGGTDLIIQRNRGRRRVEELVDLSRIPDLDRIDDFEHGLRIGALTRMRSIEKNATVLQCLPLLAEAARVVGGVQVRNMATLAGNIGNASPGADVVPVLVTLAAVAVIAGPEGERRTPVVELLAGPGRTTLQASELITHIEIPRLVPGSAFLKAGRRKAMELAIVNVAASLELDAAGRIGDAHLTLGAVAEVSLPVSRAGDWLLGEMPSDALFAKVAALAAELSRPITDVRASADYRRHLVGVLTKRALALAHRRALGAAIAEEKS